MKSGSATSSLRWPIIALPLFATLINYLDRQALSVAAPILRMQFHLSDIDYSRIVFAFMLAYTIMSGISGIWIDRLGTRAGYALFVAWWSLCAMKHAFARGALSLGIFRFLLGIGESGNWPAAVKVVAEWFTVEERSIASGIFNSGSSAGAILAPPIIVLILLKWGWRSTFVAVGCPGLCLAGRMAAVVSRAGSHGSRGCLAAERASLASAAFALCLEFHTVEGFHGSGVVLLHPLVS